MSEQSDATMPEMDEQKLLDSVINVLKPNLAEAILLCAIPHWFNKEILAWLLGEGREPSEQTRMLLDELRLKKLVVVHRPDDQSYEVHEKARDLLLRRWRDEDTERFRELNMTVAAYFTYILQMEESSGEQRAEWEREEMYHLLVADEERGIDLFINLCNRASELSRLSTLELLLRLTDEETVNLSAGSQFWAQFFRGKLALLFGDWDDALKTWEMLERDQIPIDLEKTLAVHLSLLYKDKGEWNKAVECFSRSLEILEGVGDERGMADTYNNLGFLYKDKEQWDEADECFDRSFNLSKKLSDERGMTISLNNLGLLYKDKGEWEEADKHFQRSLGILERAARSMAATYNNLGFLYKDKRQWKKAEKYFQCSLVILDVIGDEHGKAAVLNSLGFLYTDRKEWAKAGRYFRLALTTLRKIGDERRMADTLSYLGFLYREKKEWEKADESFKKGQILLENMHDERGTAAMLNNLGVLHKRKGDLGRSYKRKDEWEKATHYFQRSLEIVEKVGDEMNAATTLYELALLYEDMEEYGKSIELMERVKKIYEQVGHPDLKIRKSKEILERIKKRQDSAQK